MCAFGSSARTDVRSFEALGRQAGMDLSRKLLRVRFAQQTRQIASGTKLLVPEATWGLQPTPQVAQGLHSSLPSLAFPRGCQRVKALRRPQTPETYASLLSK